MSTDIFIATNNGEIGGGEVMLLNIARTLRTLGYSVVVVGPAQPFELLEAAQDEGFATVTLSAHNRKAYMAQLLIWKMANPGKLLWCNGLVPALATLGHRKRIVHLHQMPTGVQKYAYRLARLGASRILVPSYFMASQLPGTYTCENWVHAVERSVTPCQSRQIVRVGFLGRPSPIKGTHTLARALELLNSGSQELVYQLVIGGETKFVNESGRDVVQKATERLGGNLKMLGWVSPSELFGQCDMLVVPSEVDESFGLVAAEAMSARVPLIVSDAGALPEVTGSEYPYIFERGDVGQLAQQIGAVAHKIVNDPNKLDELLNHNYWRWAERYSPAAGKRRIEELLATLDER